MDMYIPSVKLYKLKPILIPSIAAIADDNTRPHTAFVAMNFIENEDIDVMD